MQLSKIQLRILLPISLLLTVGALLAFYVLKNYQVENQRLASHGVEQVKQSLGFLKQEIEYRAFEPDSIRNAQRLLMSKSIGEGIETLVLFSSSGQVLASRFAEKDRQTKTLLPDFTSAPQDQYKISLAADGESIQAYVPLTLNALTNEVIRERALLFASYKLSTNKAVLWQQIRSDFQEVWLAVFFAIIVLAILQERLITRPLAKLVNFSQQLSNDYSGLQHTGTYLGEIATLKQALNTMSSKVARTINDLNTQQENLEVTLHSIGDAVISTDGTGLVTRMNPVAEQLTGWYAYEARGLPLKTIFPIISASTREAIPSPVDKVLSTGETVYLSNHTTLIAKDGSEYHIADSASPIRNGDDNIEGMILVFNDVTEQYKLRLAARNIQLQIEGFFNDMQAMAAILEADGTVTFINNTPLKIRGLKLDDISGKNFWECPWFDYGTSIQDLIHTDCLAAAQGKQILRDIHISTSRGELMWIQFSIHPVFDAQGQIIQLLAEGHDINARKKAEEELSASLQHIKLYREQTPLATIEWNMDFQIKDWNAAASKLFGYTRDEAIGRDATLIAPECTAPEVDHVWDSITHQSGGEININRNITKDGRSILCEWHNKSIVEQTGKVIGMTSLVLDITAEHDAKSALIKQEQEQREILNSLVQGIITLDERGKILNTNPAVEQIFGYSNQELIGKDLSTIMPGFDADKIERYLTHYGKAGEIPTLDVHREAMGLRKNKTQFSLHATAAELPPATDGTRRFLSACYDLTETKLQQAHLQRTQKMNLLGKVVGGIAHDYNNMLGVILGYADLMTLQYHHIEGLDKYIEQISQAGERGRKLTQRMLAFSKHESSHPETIELHPVLVAQNELLRKSLTALVKLEYELCDSPWTIYFDASELEDTLLNLAINAKHAMSDDGVLTLATHKRHLSFSEARILGLAEGDYMELNVTDNGSGISEELQSKIFDPFFTTKGSEGTGLGLSQAYSFMDRCGGTIQVESNLGVGTCFSLYFPRYEGAAAHQAEVEDHSARVQASGETILIVDDEPALRELTREILTIAGYKVLVAGDGETALAILVNEPIDLMISDIIMPKMTGYELAKIVNKKYPLTKIQLASGYSSEQALKEDQEVLHSNILRKPFRSSQLLDTVLALLGSPINAQ
ncbi:MAG: PAS domain S-box protein [Candidatus Reddybacter sp.]